MPGRYEIKRAYYLCSILLCSSETHISATSVTAPANFKEKLFNIIRSLEPAPIHNDDIYQLWNICPAHDNRLLSDGAASQRDIYFKWIIISGVLPGILPDWTGRNHLDIMTFLSPHGGATAACANLEEPIQIGPHRRSLGQSVIWIRAWFQVIFPCHNLLTPHQIPVPGRKQQIWRNCLSRIWKPSQLSNKLVIPGKHVSQTTDDIDAVLTLPSVWLSAGRIMNSKSSSML